MFLNIQMYFIILKTYDQHFTLTTKKSLHIIFNWPTLQLLQVGWASHAESLGITRAGFFRQNALLSLSQYCWNTEENSSTDANQVKSFTGTDHSMIHRLTPQGQSTHHLCSLSNSSSWLQNSEVSMSQCRQTRHIFLQLVSADRSVIYFGTWQNTALWVIRQSDCQPV